MINEVLAPFLLAGVLVIATGRKIMRNQPSSPLSVASVCLTTLLMFAAAIWNVLVLKAQRRA